LILCKPQRDSNNKPLPIGYLKPLSIDFTRDNANYDSLKFTMGQFLKTHYNYSRKLVLMEDPNWNLLKEGLIIDLVVVDDNAREFEEYFYIKTITRSGECEFSIDCIPIHQQLFDTLKLRGYNNTRKLLDYASISGNARGEQTITYPDYSDLEDNKHTIMANGQYIAEDYLKGGIMNYIVQEVLKGTWTIDYYDTSLNHIYDDIKKRYFDLNGATTEDEITTAFLNQAKSDLAAVKALLNRTYTINYVGDDSTYQVLEKTGVRFSQLVREASYSWSNISGKILADLLYEQQSSNQFELLRDKIDDFNEILQLDLDATPDTQILAYYCALIDDILASILNIIDNLYSASPQYFTAGFMEELSKSNTTEVLQDYRYYINDCVRANLLLMYNGFLNDIYPLLSPYKNCSGSFVYKTNSFEQDNLTSVFTQLQQSYTCIMKFDNVNQTISIYGRDNSEINTQLDVVLSTNNNVSLSYKPDYTKIVTRLYLKGKNDLTINSVNPTGERYIDDFTPFLSDEYMSEDLQNKLNIYYAEADENNDTLDYVVGCNNYQVGRYIAYYNEKIKTAEKTYADMFSLVSQLKQYWLNSSGYAEDVGGLSQIQLEARNTASEENNLKIEELEKELVEICPWYDNVVEYHNRNITVFQNYVYNLLNYDTNNNLTARNRFTAVFGMEDSGSGEAAKRAFWEKVNSYADKYYPDTLKSSQMVDSALMTIYESIRNYVSAFLYARTQVQELAKIRWSNNEQNLLAELQNFIIEQDLNVSYLYDEEQAYFYGKKYFKNLQTIPISATVEVVNDYSISFNDVGKYVYVTSLKDNVRFEPLRLLSYSCNPVNATATLTFGNTEEVTDALNTLTKDILGYTVQLNDKLDTYTETWKDYLNTREKMIRQEEEINADLNNITDKSGNTIINGNGIALTPLKTNAIKKTSTGLYAPDYSKEIESIINGGIGGGVGGGLYTDMLETNIDNYICIPVVQKDSSGNIDWTDPTHTYRLRTTLPLEAGLNYHLRNFIRIEGSTVSYKEQRIIPPSGSTFAISNNNAVRLALNGKYLFFASIDEDNNGFTNITFQPPRKLYGENEKVPDSIEVGETDKALNTPWAVYVLKPSQEFTKFNQEMIKSVSSAELATNEIRTIYGAGNGHAHNGETEMAYQNLSQGQFGFIKTQNSGGFIYISRADQNPNGDKKYGILLQDDSANNKIGNYLITDSKETKMYPIVVAGSLTDAPVIDAPIGSIIFIGAVSS
jgi:hypothetical protein